MQYVERSIPPPPVMFPCNSYEAFHVLAIHLPHLRLTVAQDGVDSTSIQLVVGAAQFKPFSLAADQLWPSIRRVGGTHI